MNGLDFASVLVGATVSSIAILVLATVIMAVTGPRRRRSAELPPATARQINRARRAGRANLRAVRRFGEDVRR